MAKKVLVLTLALLLIASLSVFGAKKPMKPIDERMLQRLERIEKATYADESIVYRYITTPEPKIFFPALPQNTAGNSYYDYQANDGARRMIANGPDGVFHFTWMNMIGPDMTNNRYMDYNSWDRAGGWLVAGGMHVTPAPTRGGYGGLDLLPDNREVLCYHRTEPDPYHWGTTISIEDTEAGLGEFTTYCIPDSVKGSVEHGGWPSMSISKVMVGDNAYMHILHAEMQTSGSVDKGVGYVRCYEKVNMTTLTCESPGWTAPLDIPANTRLVPNVIPYRIATSRLGGNYVATSPTGKVAIVWLQNTAASQTQNELEYVESTNNGQDWIDAGTIPAPIRLTDYAAGLYEDRAYDDVAVVYDLNDELHIMWTTYKSTDANDVSLWHWTLAQGIRKAGFASASSAVDPGAWNLLIAKFNLGVGCKIGDPAYNYLYFSYTKFVEGDISASEFANGDIYVKASSNFGLSWGPETNLTNTNSNGCTPGNCFSEHWSSLAERVDDSLYVQYIEDKDAGGVPQDEGTFTLNPVKFLRYPRPLVPQVASMTYSPTQMRKPVRWAVNGGSKADEIDFDNVGTATLYVQISAPTAAAYVTINPANFNIVEAGLTQTVDITFSGAGKQDTFLTDSLMILSNNETSGEVYSDTEWVHFHFVVTDSFYYAEWDTVEVGDLRVAVSNVGNLGNQGDSTGMFYNGYNYLFEFTPAFATADIGGSGPVGFTWLHDHHDFLPEAHVVCHIDKNGVLWCKDKFAFIFPPRLLLHHLTHMWWGYWTKYSLIKIDSWRCENKIEIWNWYMWNPPPIWWPDIMGPTDPQGGYFGIAADWDVPAEASGQNIGDYDDTLHLAWLTADTVGFEDFYGAFLFLDASVFTATSDTTADTSYHATEPFGAHVLTNPTQLYPFGGYNDDSLFKYMSTPGYSIESDSAQDMNIVMSFIEELAPNPATVIGLHYALIVTDQGLDSLYAIASMLKHAQPGDANGDGSITVSDVIYVVNYLFKNGPDPWFNYSDANGDGSITVSDVIYLVNYLFKNGPPAKYFPGLGYQEPPW